MLVENRIEENLNQKQKRNLFREIKREGTNGIQINLASNDYLSLRKHEEVIRGSQEAIERYGTTSSGSPVVASYLPIHFELEEIFCDWIGMNAGLIWPSGFVANESILKELPQKGDLVLADEFMHFSALKGVIESGARLVRFSHNNMAELEEYLAEHSERSGQIFVVTESLYSMEGDYPDLGVIAKLKQRYGFYWILDEAHALGWYGPQGRGLAAHFGVVNSVDVLISTLGKALVSQGAVTLFRNKVLRDYFINNAKGLMYSTSPAPALVGAAIAAIGLIRNTVFKEQSRWLEDSSLFREELREFIDVPRGNSPIVPLIISDEKRMLKVKKFLMNNGILTAGIRPPSVPQGKSRLRISLSRGLSSKFSREYIVPVFKAALKA